MPKIQNVLLSFFMPLEDRYLQRLRDAAPEANFILQGEQELTPELLGGIDVLMGELPPNRFAHMQSLRWFHTSSSGVDVYLRDNAVPKQVLFTNSTGIYGEAIGEHALAVLLALANRLPVYRDNQRDCHWNREGFPLRMAEATILVVGLGDIGGSFARKAHGLGAQILGIRRRQSDKPDYVDELHPAAALPDLLPRADAVVLSVPNTADTKHLMGRENLALMKEGAYLINVGRGDAVDSTALAEALNSGRLGGAGLDVTDPEPLPPDHPLWQCPGLLLTPHVSGFYHNALSKELLMDLCVDNLLRYQRGEPLRNTVNRETGYRG